jgi:hypothetical protein
MITLNDTVFLEREGASSFSSSSSLDSGSLFVSDSCIGSSSFSDQA